MSINECADMNKNYSPENPRIMLYHINGLPIEKLLVYHIISYDDKFLKIEQVDVRMLKPNSIIKTYKIPIDRIIAVEVLSNEIIKEKEKSVIGRGIVGGIAFGPAGLVLGGMSGLKNKTTKKVEYVFCVSYFGKDETEIKNILFGVEVFLKTCIDFSKDFMNKNKIAELETNDDGEVLL